MSAIIITTFIIVEFFTSHDRSALYTNELTVDGLKNTYNVGEQINFRVKFNEMIGDCTQPYVIVKNQTDQIIWKSKEIAIPCSTDTTLHHGDGEFEFGNSDLGYLRINQTGSYFIHIWFAKEIVEKITVIQSVNNVENQTSISATQIIPSCVSNISHQYANAGPMGLPLCPVAWYTASGKILNATGFYGIYNYTDYSNVQNYVLEPGHNGTLTYSILLSSINTDARIPEYPDGVNISNDVEFMHDANMQNHPGIDVSVYPQEEIIREHTSTLVNMTISASQNASHGTYWMRLPPGICMGGQIIVLTITDCPEK
jgi:hypothetical protein